MVSGMYQVAILIYKILKDSLINSAEIFLGLPLFPGMSNHDQLQLITRMLGYV